MMPPAKDRVSVTAVTHLKNAVSAHAAVRLDIATHVEKETAKRLAERKLAASKAALGKPLSSQHG